MILTPYILPLLASAAILIWMALYALRFKDVPTAHIFSLLMGLAAIWSLNQALEISMTSLELKILMLQMRLAANAFLAPVELMLVLAYTGKSAWLSRTRLGLLLIVPVGVFCLSLTSNFHKFFRYDFTLDTSGPFPILLKTNAWGYWLFIIYTSLLILLALGLLLAALRNRTLSIRNTLVLFFACLVPFVVNLFFNLGMTPIRGFDLGPTSFVITGGLYAWALLRQDLFNALPVAHEIAIDNISDLLIVLDAKQRIVDYNPAAQAVFEFSNRSLEAASDGLPSLWADFFQRYNQVDHYRGEVWLGSGTDQRTYDLSISTLPDKHQHSAGRLFLLHDLTERKQAEDALRQSEERYRLLADDAPLAILVSDQKTGEVLYTNRRVAELFEIPVDQLLMAKTPELYANPQDRERILTLLNVHGQVTDFEVCARKGDGREFWISITSNKIIYNGRPAIHTTCIDISQRKQIEEALRTSEERFRTLFEQAAVGVALLETKNGRYVRVNQRYCDLLGYSMEEMLNLHFQDITHPDDLQLSMQNNDALLAGKIREFSMEKRYLRKDGQVVWGKLSASSLWKEDELPEVYYHVAVVEDITARKQTEEALRTSEVRFRTLFEHAAVGVSLADTRSGRYLRVNQYFCDTLGYTMEEMLRLHYQDITYPDDMQENLDYNALLLDGKIREYSIEKRFVHKDGRIVWCKLTVSPMWLTGEHPEDYIHIGVTEDITERKRVEEELRTSEGRFRTLFEQAAVGVALLETKTGRYVRINQKYCDFLGYTLEEMLQLRFQDVTYPEDTQTNVDYNSLLIEGKIREFENEKRYLRKDGQMVWGILSASPLWLPGETPEVYTHIAVVQDISERKKTEEALLESEEKFRSLFEGHTSIMVLTDPGTGRIVDVNPSACHFYGYSRRELLEMKITDINCLSPTEIMAKMKEVEKGQTKHFIFPHRLANGEIRTVEVDSAPIFMQGKPVLFSIIRDISEQKKMEAELIESQKMVGIGTLAAGIAHEINSPLQVITGYSDSLLKELQVAAKLEGERPERQLKTINRNAWRVAEIVRSLQHYAHPNSERASQTELNELVKDTLILIEHQLKSWSNIAVETELVADLPPFMCDQNKIIQVLINLLSNARDAMPMGGTIKIDTAYQADPERLVLKVADDGLGIHEVVRKRIFDPFFTTKIVGKGTGLGLSIVQSIVRVHGGEIQVESAPGKGTTFTIMLPLTPPVQEPENLPEDSTRARYD